MHCTYADHILFFFTDVSYYSKALKVRPMGYFARKSGGLLKGVIKVTGVSKDLIMNDYLYTISSYTLAPVRLEIILAVYQLLQPALSETPLTFTHLSS